MRKTFISLLSSLALAGCYSSRPFPEMHRSEFDFCAEKSYTICVEPFETEEECESAFGRNITKKDFLPFFVQIENNSNFPIRIPRQSFEFKDSLDNEWKQADSFEISQKYHRIAALEGYFAFPVRTLVLWNALKWNEKIDADFKNKQLRDQVQLSPEESSRGFVYFQAPKNTNYKNFDTLDGKLTFSVYEEEREITYTANLSKQKIVTK